MKNFGFALLISLGCAFASFAQDATTTDPAVTPTTTIFVARTGVRTDVPHATTYRLFEVFQLHGKWIVPDGGYIDFGTGRYHELFIGGGRTLYDGKKAMLVEELYFDQAIGPLALSARYLQPWTLLQIRFAPKWTSETVYFPYLPLNQSALVQHVLERAKLEYTVNKTFKFGGGYAGYKYGDDRWQNKPLVTTTVSTRGGAFEFWLQKMPGGAQVQVRYTLAYTSLH
jgi:hypothetical protein